MTKDYTGMRFGDLSVKERISEKGHKTKYLCNCDCGNKIVVTGSSLISGHTKSCGHIRRKHGYAQKERLYTIWIGMRQRCNNCHCRDYAVYGLRGIAICKSWNNYLIFREWALANGYNDKLTIDRINGNGNYEPTNCRWVGFMEQNNNLRSNKFIEYNGKIHTLAEWARILHIPYKLINQRFHRKWSFNRIVEVGASLVYSNN